MYGSNIPVHPPTRNYYPYSYICGFFPILVYFSILIPKMGKKKIIYQNEQILPAR